MNRLPLEGMRVVDLGHDWACPHCTRILADFGAEVIVVEYPRRLSLFRGGRTKNGAYNQQPSWFQVNRNKYSITLDLKDQHHRGIFVDLVKTADVLVENGRTGVIDRLGFGYPVLKQLRPDIIMLSMPAYGATGPYAAYPAYGAVLEVMSGIQNLTGYGGGGKPQRLREMDVINGVGGACAVLTALFHRLKTGQGQHIDLSQVELPTHALLGEHLLEYALHATHALPLGNRHRWFAPQGCYRCRGDDKWVTLTVRSDREWQGLCQAVGHPEWAEDSRFSTHQARVANHDEIDRLIEQWTRGRTHYEAVQILQRHAVPSGAVLTVEELAEDPHLRARGYFVQGVPGTDRVFMGMPWRTSACAPTVRWRGPDLGEHNEHFIRGQLGRPKEDVPAVREDELGTAYDPD